MMRLRIAESGGARAGTRCVRLLVLQIAESEEGQEVNTGNWHR